MRKNIGFVGLGIMGKPMAINIKKSGYNLSVFDRHQENIKELTQIGAIARKSPADTAKYSDIIITMVQDSPQSLEAITGENGLIIGIDHFGASAPHKDLAEEFGFVPEKIESQIRDHIQKLKDMIK